MKPTERTRGQNRHPWHWSIPTWLGLLAAGGLITLLGMHLAATSGLLQADHGDDGELSEAPPPVAGRPDPFKHWSEPKPDLVLVLSGQQHGYLNPCGCSRPQYGGLQRRYNFIQELKQRGWPVAGVDLGDLLDPAAHRGPQSLLKYQTSMKALREMGYLAVGLGQFETEMPLITTLAEYALNQTVPTVLAANLKNKENNFPSMLASWVDGGPVSSSLKVGVVGIVGPTVRTKIPAQNPQLDFDHTIATLNGLWKDMMKPDVRVLLYQGSFAEAKACAQHCVNDHKDFQVVLALSAESEPFGKPERIGNTWVVTVGHKGRYVGVVGFWKTGKAERPFETRYELVMLGEEYEVKPAEAATNPVAQMLEDYTKQVQAGNYLDKYPRSKHPVQVSFPNATYVGSDACASCHRHATEVWKNHPHSHAFQTLVDAKLPSLRQFDGECVVCHTVGFGLETGYADQQKTPDLINVGCESCHGPGSLHADLGKKTPPQMLALMNPFKPKPDETPEQLGKRLLALDLACQKCHDVDNDVHWNFKEKWPKVIHHTPKPQN